MMRRWLWFALNRPKTVFALAGVFVILALSQLPKITVDTDPENMLPADAPVRVQHHQVKEEFALYDMVVLGVVNTTHTQGVFNQETLGKVYHLAEAIQKIDGVIGYELVSLSTKDNIDQAGMGAVRFDWLMPAPPASDAEALQIFKEAQDHPLFRGSVVAEDGQALAIYIPIKEKTLSFEVAQAVRELLVSYEGPEEYHITGLPVAEDQFGVEMFKQMAISAPLAGLIIFALMWAFFKSWALVVAPMIVALMTVIITMGLLIGLGHPVHIMSSMIPIFLMPIAVLDSVHILSEFFDQYHHTSNRQQTIQQVLHELFQPMLFTSLTSAAGFFSLSFSPIPPVQVFGVFVAMGVVGAWVLTLIIVPAYIMLLPMKVFKRFERVVSKEKHHGWMDHMLNGLQGLTIRYYRRVVITTMLLVVLSIYGMSRIVVNDNPVRWFNAQHPIRVADRVLNKHFTGTYEAYLVMAAKDEDGQVFAQPAMLHYIEEMQAALIKSGHVGKTFALTDIVKKIYYELTGGRPEKRIIPSSKAGVVQSLIAYENSHKPDDLWHLSTPNYSKANIWLQLKSGDNKDMSQVLKFVEEYMAEHPTPYTVTTVWAGLTYINVAWQNNMVGGMMRNFMGSFVIVLLMMLLLFRSPIKALISMIPLSVTIVFIYGGLGFYGKDFDMPVAVLSALTLGLSVDFAIHFIQRAVDVQAKGGSWEETSKVMFGGPGRAIVRNALVVAIGFLPLLAAPLIPYKTVGFFMFAIMAVSSIVTLLVLPSLIAWQPQIIQKKEGK